MTYISTKMASELCIVTERTIQRKAKEYIANRLATNQECIDYKAISGKGRRGKTYLVLLENLTEDEQARYYGEEKPKGQCVYLSLTEDQQRLVNFKHATVIRYKDFKSTYRKADKMAAFLVLYNSEHPDNPLTRRQVNHWEKLFDRDGLDGFIDRRGGYNKDGTSVPDDMWQVFLKLWSTQGKVSAQLCYNALSAVFPDREIPHYSSFIRKLE